MWCYVTRVAKFLDDNNLLGVFAMVTANSKETIGLHWHLHCCFVHFLAIVA